MSGGFSRIYKIELKFDDLKALKANLGIDAKKLVQLFSDHFIPRLMAEAFKQLKRAEDDVGAGNKALEKASRMFGKATAEGANDEGEQLQDEEKAATPGIQDDDDEISEGEKEIMQEINQEMDGNVKHAKDVRGYEDSVVSDEDMKDEAGQNSEDEALGKLIKPLRETHSKYLQYLKNIDFNKSESTASVDLAFPLEFKKVLMLTIAEQTLQKVLVRSVKNIEKCSLVKPKKEGEEPYLIVQGINFDAFYPHQDIIDVTRIETNHSYALKGKYGVEAMRANIVKEVLMVFGVYGISVDKRHLSLIGDFMSFNGDYRAFNRIGMEESSSPFLKMSYETTMKYLVSASQANETDDMSAPSSAIVMGQVPRVGTGMFDLIQESAY